MKRRNRGQPRLLGCIAAATAALAVPVHAHATDPRTAPTAQEAGLRTLAWPGMARADAHPSARAASDGVASGRAVSGRSAPTRAEPVRVQPVAMPDYTAAAPGFPTSLTPATAFGVPPSVGAARIAAVPQPAAAQPSAVQPPVIQTPVVQTPVVQTPASRSPEPAAPPASADPMAPRADAPIHRMAQPQPSSGPVAEAEAQARPAAASDGPTRDGARYYSVHREAGRAPDPTTLPAPFFLDGARMDLAEPPPPPTIMRNQRGLAPSVADVGL